MPTEDYSSLEVLHYDHQANAPQRDHAKYPPELDTAVLAPQAVALSGPEVAYDTSPPEVLDVVGDSSSPFTKKAESATSRTQWLSRRLVLTICVVSAAVAVIVAVSVRFGLASKESTRLPEPNTVTQTVGMSPNATAQPTGDVVPPHGILDNSALAAVELPNGDRRVFFQENNGNIREAVYQESSKQWSLGLTNNVTSDAKRLTPLAAIAHNKTAGPDGGISINTEILLFYISTYNSLSCAHWGILNGWKNASGQFNASQASASSRQLSALVLASPLQFYLFYENSDGNPTVLRTLAIGSPWIDHTSSMRDRLSNNVNPDTQRIQPINFGASFSTLTPSDDELQIFLATESNDALIRLWCSNNTSPCTSFAQFYLHLLGDLKELYFKLACFIDGYPSIFWINSSSLHIHEYMTLSSPGPPFPFNRMAAISSSTSKEYSVVLYHQITNDVLIENKWSNVARVWLKSNITIPTS